MVGNYTPYPDEDGIVVLFDQLAPPVCLYALRLCHDPVTGDNVVGDAFAQLMEQFAVGKAPPSDIRVYLYQAAYRSIVKYLRESQNHPSAGTVDSASEKSDVTASQPQGDEKAMKEALFFALHNELTEEQRHVMSLYFLDDFSVKETAEILGKSESALRANLEDIRKAVNNHPELFTDSLAALWHKMNRRRKAK